MRSRRRRGERGRRGESRGERERTSRSTRRGGERQLAAATSPYAILVVPLLVEGGRPRERAQRVLVVDCRPETQVARVMQRNNLPREQVLAILAAQASREQRLAAADDVVDNDGPPDGLDARVQALHAHYLALAPTPA